MTLTKMYKKPQRVVISENLIKLTNNFKLALILKVLDDYTKKTGHYLNLTEFKSYGFCFRNISIQTIKASLLKLEKMGVIKISKTNPQKISEILINKNLISKGVGNKLCQWCKIKTFILHKYHFPIPKNKGGTMTVNICPNCHSDFHAMEYEIFITKKAKEVLSNE